MLSQIKGHIIKIFIFLPLTHSLKTWNIAWEFSALREF
jgi:hypothetical protein